MTEEIWLLLIIWIFSLIFAFKTQKVFFGGFSAMISFIFGIAIIQTPDFPYPILGLVMFICFLFMLFETLFRFLQPEKKKKGKKK